MKILDPFSARSTIAFMLALLMIPATLTGCATDARPLPVTKRTTLTPAQGEVSMQAKIGEPVGNVVPVEVSIANGTDEPFTVDPTQVFAIDENGQRVLPVPAEEASKEAGDAKSLKTALTTGAKDAGIGLGIGALLGAAVGAIAGAFLGSGATGAAVGAAIGGGAGAAQGGISGISQGQGAAYQDAANQINALSLQPGQARPNFSQTGYVFFPKGTYQSVQMNLVNQESHQTFVASAPWGSGSVVNATAFRK